MAEKNFRAKFRPRLDLSPNYFCFQIHFLNCYSSEFLHFAYYNRQKWFLANSGSVRSQKKLEPNFLGLFRPKFGPKLVFDSYLDIYWYNLSDVTFSDFIQWFLITIDVIWNWPQNWGLSGVKHIIQNMVFSLWTLTHIAFVWIHINPKLNIGGSTSNCTCWSLTTIIQYLQVLLLGCFMV